MPFFSCEAGKVISLRSLIEINAQKPAVTATAAGRNTVAIVAISETDVETFLAVSSKMTFVSPALFAAAAPSFRIFIIVYPAPAHTKTTGIAKPHEIPNAAPAAIPIPSFNFIKSLFWIEMFFYERKVTLKNEIITMNFDKL